MGSARLDEHELLHRVGLGVGRAEEVGREHEREVAHVHLVLLRERRRLVGDTHEPAQQRALRRRELVEQPLASVRGRGRGRVRVRIRVRQTLALTLTWQPASSVHSVITWSG